MSRPVIRTVKGGIERALLLSGIPGLSRARQRRNVIILAYHNVLPDGISAEGDTSLHLKLHQFEQHLDALAETHLVVSLASVLEDDRSWDRPRAVITFDDAYLGAISVGLPAVARRGMPATVFVAPGLLGSTTWWDRLADARLGAVEPAVRARALTVLAGKGEAIMTDARHSALNQLPRALHIATEGELLRGARLTGITIGSHSWTHANLAALAHQSVERELHNSIEWLRTNFDERFIPWLSYPYGLYSPDVARLAADAGLAGALRVDGGWLRHDAACDVFGLPRLNVPASMSLSGFQLRLCGWNGR